MFINSQHTIMSNRAVNGTANSVIHTLELQTQRSKLLFDWKTRLFFFVPIWSLPRSWNVHGGKKYKIFLNAVRAAPFDARKWYRKRWQRRGSTTKKHKLRPNAFSFISYRYVARSTDGTGQKRSPKAISAHSCSRLCGGTHQNVGLSSRPRGLSIEWLASHGMNIN